MAVLKGFTFDGIKSVDYGVIVTGSNLYGAPERVVDMIEVPGRNGALALDQGRYSNVQVVYHCVMYDRDQADFAQRIAGLRNELCSRHSYARLENDWDTDEYRLGMYREGLDADIVLERGGEFDLIFDCKPQRFLTSGEDTITVGDWGDVTEYSGDIVSFEGDEMTAVKSLSVSLSPIQNLNGYDHPWVGGGNVTLVPTDTLEVGSFNEGEPAGRTIEYLKTTTVTRRLRTANMLAVTAGKPYSVSWAEGYDACFAMFDSSGGYLGQTDGFVNWITAHDYYEYPITVQNVAYVAIALKRADNAEITDADFTACKLKFSPTPYSNICPITGRTGQTVTVVGKNLLDDSIKSFASGGFVFFNTAGDRYHKTATLQAGTYTFSVTYSQAFETVKAHLSAYDVETDTRLAVAYNNTKVSFTLAKMTDISLGVQNSGLTTSDILTAQLELGTTATAYEPYAGTTYTRAFVDGQGNELTVYGGEDEIVGGVLTVTQAMIDLGTLQWGKYIQWGSDHTFLASLTFDGTGITTGVPPETFKSDAYKGITQAAALGGTDTGFWVRGDNQTLYFSDARYTDASAYKSAVSGLHLVYPLATPLTYQLTANEVETLIGTNHVWSDAGEVTVEIADDPNKIVNPTLYDAKPLIKVSGYGTVQVGSVTITIEGSASDVTYIDCDSMECYRLNGLAIVSANSAVSFSSYDFPVLEADAITGITYSTNISQVQIVPRWWQL